MVLFMRAWIHADRSISWTQKGNEREWNKNINEWENWDENSATLSQHCWMRVRISVHVDVDVDLDTPLKCVRCTAMIKTYMCKHWMDWKYIKSLRFFTHFLIHRFISSIDFLCRLKSFNSADFSFGKCLCSTIKKVNRDKRTISPTHT